MYIKMAVSTNVILKYLSLLIGLLSFQKGSVFAEVVITPVNTSISEGDSVTLTCTLTGTDVNATSYTWFLKKSSGNVITVGYLTAACKSAVISINTSLYNYTCPSRRESTWTVKEVTRQNHRERYHCNVETLSRSENSGYTFLNVQVPISSVNMTVPSTSSVTIRENVFEKFKCKTSGGLPAATVVWNKDSGTPGNFSDDVEITTNIVTSSSTVNYVTEVTSTLTYLPSRNDTGWRIYCTASNINGQRLTVSQRKPLLNVQYPPNGQPIITGYTDGGEYRVIEGTQGQLSCSVSGGNPLPTLTWNCINNGTSQTTGGGNVTNIDSWMAERGQDKTCTCRSSHYSGNKNVSVRIKIMYPPTIPTFKIKTTAVYGTIEVIRGNSLFVTCRGEGQPAPSYRWTYPNNVTSSGQLLSVRSVQNNGRYACEVQNTMNPSVGGNVSGRNSSIINVLILYPPTSPTFKYWNTSGENILTMSLDVIKGDTFKVACMSTGVPAPSYHWNNMGTNQILTVNSITADQSRTCTARNTMVETVGQTLTKSATARLKINALYPPTIPTLSIKSTVVYGTVEIIRGNSLFVLCRSEGQPAPSYRWTYPNNVTSNGQQLSVSSVQNNGRYTCDVQNSMNLSVGGNVSGRNSSFINVLILYPPTRPTFKYWNTSGQNILTMSLDVMKGDTFKVACMSTGVPAPTYHWNNMGTNQILTVNSITADQSRICTARNTMMETVGQTLTKSATTTLKINVLYPPTIPTLIMKSTAVYGDVAVIRGNSLFVLCRSEGQPAPSYRWTYPNNVTSNGQQLSVSSVQNNGRYTCDVQNTMNLSVGWNVSGRNSSFINVLILYPPTSPTFKYWNTSGKNILTMSLDVMKGDIFKVACMSTGVPAPTYHWNNMKTNQILTINSVTADQSRICTARNTMVETVGQTLTKSATATLKINVLYPPTMPTLIIKSTAVYDDVAVIRGNSLFVTCKSEGQPAPSYRWTYPNNDTSNDQQLNVSNVQNNGRYTCDVQNSMNLSVSGNVSGRNSSFINVLILYPPTSPTFKYWNTSGENILTMSLDVMKGDTFKVACMSTGVPAPSYHWNNMKTNQILAVNSITADQSRICTARNAMVETVGQTITKSATATLKINVLYPPSVVTMRYLFGESSVVNLATTLSIIEGNPFTVTCSSDSKPAPTYKWTGKASSSSATVKVNSTSRVHIGTITCEVENTMTRTFANPENVKTGSTSGSFNLQVLYPPVIGELANISVVEGLPLTVSCPVTVGNPPETTYEWRKKSRVWKRTQQFTIGTTSRTDATIYTCKVSNSMTQTGNKPVSQPDTKSFYLNVWYRTSVTSFYIEGYTGQTIVSVQEHHEDVQFVCSVDAHPASTIRIMFEGKVLKEESNTNTLSFVKSKVACLDGGVYTCEGRNNYGPSSQKNITFFVICPPRPLHRMKQNITSFLHVPVTLRFTALAYPPPGPQGFTWHKQNGIYWTPVLSNVDLNLSSSALQSVVTIMNVSNADFGHYRLTVTNSIGSYIQHLFLTEEVPLQSSTEKSETCTDASTTRDSSTPIIIGVTLGIVCVALAIFAVSVLILYKRQSTRRGVQSPDQSTNQKTYVNLTFKSDIAENQDLQDGPGTNSTEDTDGHNEDTVTQYTSLDQYSRDDRTTYDVLKAK